MAVWVQSQVVVVMRHMVVWAGGVDAGMGCGIWAWMWCSDGLVRVLVEGWGFVVR